MLFERESWPKIFKQSVEHDGAAGDSVLSRQTHQFLPQRRSLGHVLDSENCCTLLSRKRLSSVSEILNRQPRNKLRSVYRSCAFLTLIHRKVSYEYVPLGLRRAACLQKLI